VYVIIALLVLILFLLIAVLVRQNMAPTTKAPASPPTQAAPAAAPATVAQPVAAAPAPAAMAPAPPTTLDTGSDVHDIYQDATMSAPPPEYSSGYEEAPALPRSKKSRSRLLDELEAQAQELDEANNGSEEDLVPASVRKSSKPVTKTADSTQENGELSEEKIKELWEQTKKEIPDRPANQAKLQTQIQEAIKDTLSLYKQVPYLHELPEKVQNSVPSINYVNHLYSEKAGGVVIINKKTLRNGQEIGPGMVVERVASDGIVVQYQGLRFKLNALSSWVNFSNKNPAPASEGKKK
ncbi:MAG TPA: general secretion pathway protein GspB, partial [Cellvibrionaceae bacterium]|nr:general secretion pathway protein GspB [Cellvibrionaceae bacterium]